MHRHNTRTHLITGIANGPGLVTLSYATWWRDNRYSVLMFRPQLRKKATNNPALKKSSAKKRLLEPSEKEVDDLFLSKFYEWLDCFTKDLSVDFIRSDDLESFKSSLPSTKDIYNLFDNGVFVKGNSFLQTKRTKKVKKIPSCGIHNEPRPSTPLRDLSPTNENFVRGKEVVSESVDKISSKGKEIFHLEDKIDNELFDYTPLNGGPSNSVTAQQG
ncbi:hypothetical protein ACH5RR_018069 [Cinchona calisaya]|uniref:Uncharacterized protein n=1 Tax=Cinchona calisaya TaxID=153742 RepID=A0ABD2ZKE0_9GENT